jgi:hypothetical protein
MTTGSTGRDAVTVVSPCRMTMPASSSTRQWKACSAATPPDGGRAPVARTATFTLSPNWRAGNAMNEPGRIP